MNFLLSLVVALMMGASVTPTNPVIAEFIEKSQTEASQNGLNVAYEESFLGPAIVIGQTLPAQITKDMLSQVPTDMFKAELLKNFSADEETKELVKAMKADNVNLILRILTTDGGNMDIIITPSELK